MVQGTGNDVSLSVEFFLTELLEVELLCLPPSNVEEPADEAGEAGLNSCPWSRTWVECEICTSGVRLKPDVNVLALTAGEEKLASFSCGVCKTPAAVFGVAPFVLTGFEELLE